MCMHLSLTCTHVRLLPMHATTVQVIVGCKYGSSGPSAGFSSFLCALLDKRVDRPAAADPLFLTFVRVKNGLSVLLPPLSAVLDMPAPLHRELP